MLQTPANLKSPVNLAVSLQTKSWLGSTADNSILCHPSQFISHDLRVTSHFTLHNRSLVSIYLFPVALQSLKDLGRLTYRFLDLFRHMFGLFGRVISPSQGLYLHRTTQYRKTRTDIHALSRIRTHDPSNQPAKTHASDRTATVTGFHIFSEI
jgi:hypothetical protein